MSDFIIDASVAGKWLIEEPESGRARALIAPRYFLRAPDLKKYIDLRVFRLFRNFLQFEHPEAFRVGRIPAMYPARWVSGSPNQVSRFPRREVGFADQVIGFPDRVFRFPDRVFRFPH